MKNTDVLLILSFLRGISRSLVSIEAEIKGIKRYSERSQRAVLGRAKRKIAKHNAVNLLAKKVSAAFGKDLEPEPHRLAKARDLHFSNHPKEKY